MAGRRSVASRRWALGFTLPLAILAFSSAQVHYLNLALNTTTRWIFLACLLIALLLRGDIVKGYGMAFAQILLIYILWCFATCEWSEVPLLSILKATALVLTATAFISAGYCWAVRHGSDNLVGFLLPVLAVVAFGSLPGPEPYSFGTSLYEGMSLNPNDLGILAASALPLTVYNAYEMRRRRNGGVLYYVWILATLSILALLWATGSRASMMCAAAIFGAFSLAVSPSWRITALLFGGLAILVAYLAFPKTDQNFYENIVAKSAENGDVLYTRRETWGESYDAALQGGSLGLGYGVAAGFTDFKFGLTANTYGREKGNSQLAVWEETGLVGLFLYIILMVALAIELPQAFNRMPTPVLKVQYALLGGLCVGLLIQSVFEAWWTSPGAAEFVTFFTTIGVLTAFRGYGAARPVSARSRSLLARSSALHPHAQPVGEA